MWVWLSVCSCARRWKFCSTIKNNYLIKTSSSAITTCLPWIDPCSSKYSNTQASCVSVCITEGWMSTAWQNLIHNCLIHWEVILSLYVFRSMRCTTSSDCLKWKGGGIWAKALHWFFFSEAEWIIFNAHTLSIFWPTITILAMMRVCVCPDALENHILYTLLISDWGHQ